MSAWIVSKKHIDVLVTFAAQNELLGGMTENEAGMMLWTENHRSVNHCYTEHTPTPTYEFSEIKDASLLTPGVILKEARCYDYQTCENDDWPTTPAYCMNEAIIACAERLAGYSSIPYTRDGSKSYDRVVGYESAPWGID